MPVQVEDLIRQVESTSAPDAGKCAAAPVLRPRRSRADPGTILSQTLAVIERERLSALGAFSLNQAWDRSLGPDQAISDNTGFALEAVSPAGMYLSGTSLTSLAGAVEVGNARQIRSTELHIGAAMNPATLAAADWDSGLARLAMTPPQDGLTAVAGLADMERFNRTQAFPPSFLQGPNAGIDLVMTLGSPFTGIGLEGWGAFATAPPISWLEPGTPDGDLFLLMRGDADPAQQLAALGRMANRVPWVPRPAAWNALVKRARRESTSVDTIKRQELQAAIVIVLGAVDQPHYYRFGREWLKGDDGHKVAVTPLHLELDRIWEWFYNEVRKAAEAALLEVPYPHVTRDVFHRKGSDGQRVCLPFDQVLLPEPTNDPLILLLDRERRTEDEERLLAVLKRASPGQRQLLALIAEGNTEAAAAQILGIAPSTARVQLYRLRKKVV